MSGTISTGINSISSAISAQTASKVSIATTAVSSRASSAAGKTVTTKQELIDSAASFSVTSSLLDAMGLSGSSGTSGQNLLSLASTLKVMRSGSGAASLIMGTKALDTPAESFKSSVVTTERSQSDIAALTNAQNILKTVANGTKIDLTA